MAIIAECPHCYTRVGLTQSGICPACGKNVKDRAGINPDLARLELGPRDLLPDNCFHCDQPTRRRVVIEQSLVRNREALFGFTLALGLVMNPLKALVRLLDDSKATRLSVVVNLPQCDRCSLRFYPEPDNVDFDREVFFFIVHKGFRDKVRQLNGG